MGAVRRRPDLVLPPVDKALGACVPVDNWHNRARGSKGCGMTIISTQAWLDGGGSRGELRTQLAQNKLVRLRRGVLMPADQPPAWELHVRRIRAVAPELGVDTLFGHVSAAVLHGLPVLPSRLGNVVVVRTGGGHGNVRPGLRAIGAQISPDDREIVSALPVTSMERTVVDLVRVLPFPEAVMIADAGLARGLDRARLLDRTSAGRGCRMARRALLFADARSESPGESLSRVRIEQAGLPSPALQTEFFDETGSVVARVDFWWEQFGLVGEFDGAVKYTGALTPGEAPAETVFAEKRREQRLQDAGSTIVRWTWPELWDGRLETRLRRAMNRQVNGRGPAFGLAFEDSRRGRALPL